MTERGNLPGYSNLQAKMEGSDPGGEAALVKNMPTSTLKLLLIWKKYLILVLTPIFLMPIPISISGTVSCCFSSFGGCSRSVIFALLSHHHLRFWWFDNIWWFFERASQYWPFLFDKTRYSSGWIWVRLFIRLKCLPKFLETSNASLV